MTSLAKQSVIALVTGFLVASAAEAAVIDFDSLPGMFNSPGSTVPVASQLSDGFLSTLGVSFSSATDYVAVVTHSPNPTVSMPNVIGGVRADGLMSYGTPIVFTFFDPAEPATRGVTDFVSIRGDQDPLLGATATMEAFDVSGNSLGFTVASDSTDGLTLSLTFPGIHSVRLTQNSAVFGFDGTIGFDNLSFNTVTAVVESGCDLGDVNMDGAINGLDVAPFVTLVTGGIYQCEGDMNEDGAVNGLDVAPLVAAIIGGGAAAVPEPSTMILAAFGLLGLVWYGRRRR